MTKITPHNPERSDSSSVSSGSRSNSSQNCPTREKKLTAWVRKMARICQPDEIVWVDGSAVRRKKLEEEAIAQGEIIDEFQRAKRLIIS